MSPEQTLKRIERLRNRIPSKHRPFTRPAMSADEYELASLLSKPARAPLKIKEKRLINGRWTREYNELDAPPLPS